MEEFSELIAPHGVHARRLPAMGCCDTVGQMKMGMVLTPRKCEDHGVVWRRGKHCPVCGKETFPLFPFWRNWQILSCVAGAVCLSGFLFGMFFRMGSCAEQHKQEYRIAEEIRQARIAEQQRIEAAARQAAIDGLPDRWKSLYDAMTRIGSAGGRLETLESFSKESRPPSITPDQIKLFMELFDGQYFYADGVRADAFKTLGRHVFENKTVTSDSNGIGLAPREPGR